VPPQLSKPVEKPPSGAQWVHEIKLDGYRMAARIDTGRVQLLTRTGLDWTAKYPSAVAALANLNVKTAYIDGELCGVDDAGVPSFAQTQAATDGERGVHLVYYAFDLLHFDGRDVSALPLIERKALLEPLIADKLGLQYNGHDTGDGELILKHAGKLGFEGVVSKTIDAPYAPRNRGLWRKAKALNRQEFVIVGWSDPEGSRPYLGALLLGFYSDDGKLIYAGRVGTGMTGAMPTGRWRRSGRSRFLAVLKTARSGLTGLVSAGGRGGLRGARERYSIAAIALRAVRVRVLICFFRASASAE
jgi:bifunctional non-homologous end joining protein LigD